MQQHVVFSFGTTIKLATQSAHNLFLPRYAEAFHPCPMSSISRVVTTLRAGLRGFDSRKVRMFLFAKSGGGGPPRLFHMGTEVLSLGTKQPGSEVSQSSASSAEVKKALS
jgi:hypothetical protein